jgi:hypothetical protein
MATYCSINEAYNNKMDAIEMESIQSNEVPLNKNTEEPHFFQELPFISANGTFMDKEKPKEPKIIEHFQSDHCTHLLSCPYCRKIFNKHKASYKKLLKIILFGLIIILIIDLMN